MKSALVDGVRLVCCDVFLVGELVPVFWLMELDLLSLKGSAVSSSRFGSVYERGGKNTQKNYTKKIFTTQIIAKV